MPVDPSPMDYEQLFAGQTIVHDERCRVLKGEKILVCDHGHRQTYESDGVGHCCDRTVIMVGLLSAARNGTTSWELDTPVVYAHATVFGQRIFYKIQRYAVMACGATFFNVDYHLLTRLFFWIGLCKDKRVTSAMYTDDSILHEMLNLVLKEAYECNYLTNACYVRCNSTAYAYRIAVPSAYSALKQFCKHTTCLACGGSDEVYPDRMFSEHRPREFDFYACLTVAVIEHDISEIWYKDQKMSSRRGKKLTFGSSEFDPETRKAFDEFLDGYCYVE